MRINKVASPNIAIDDYERVLQFALSSALEYCAGIGNVGVAPTASLGKLRGQLDRPLPDERSDPVSVIEALVKNTRGGLARSTSGRYFGWVIGGVTPSALAADWLTSVWDQNAAQFAVTPAAAVVEEVCGKWLAELLNLPASASFALVTGCQMAHVTCLAAARHAILKDVGWDVETQGLRRAPAIHVFSSTQRHGSIERAMRILGIGTDSIHDLRPDSNGKLRPKVLEHALWTVDREPSIVLLQAGDLNTGTFDDFQKIIPVARRFGAWIHVDGAFGMWAATSPKHAHLLDGVEHADSWAVDGHKWLNVPYDSGYAFVGRPEAHSGSLAHQASYLYHSHEARDPIDWTPEYSRRARGFATYAAIAALGRAGVREIVSRCCDMATAIVDGMAELPGAVLVSRPIINQGLVRFLDPAPNATDDSHDQRTDAITKSICDSGAALFACTTWRGRRVMRVSVSNWRTSMEDVDRVLAVARELLQEPQIDDESQPEGPM